METFEQRSPEMKQSSRSSTFRNWDSWLGVALFVVACVLYGSSLPGRLYMDDVGLLSANPVASRGPVWQAFIYDYWGPEANTGLFRPITVLSLLANQLVPPGGALAFHGVNIALHALATALVFFLLRKMGVARITAFSAMLFFAVHPIHDEVVNQVVGRAEILAVSFLALAGLAALGQTRWGTPIACLWYLAALLSKESALVFLAVLPLLGVYGQRARGPLPRRLGALWGYLAVVTVGWLLWRSFVVRWGPNPDLVTEVMNPLAHFASGPRVLAALQLQLVYLRNLAAPFWLQGVYSGNPWGVPVTTLWSPWVLGLAAAIAGAGWFGWDGWKRGKAYGLAVPLYAVSFAVTANIFFPLGVAMANRLAYFPSVWFCLAAASVVTEFRWDQVPRTRAGVLVGAGVVWVGILCTVLTQRNLLYRDPVRLWRADVRQAPENCLAWLFLAEALLQEGEPSKADEAYRGMLRENPDFYGGAVVYADFLVQRQRIPDGMALADNVIKRGAVGEERARAQIVLAMGNAQLGDIEAANAFLAQVEGTYRDTEDYLVAEGRVAEARGALREAVAVYRRAGFYAQAVDRMVPLLLQLGELEEARAVLLADLKRRETPLLWNWLGVACSLLGDRAGAVVAFSKAVELRPGVEGYRENLERAVRELPQGSASGTGSENPR